MKNFLSILLSLALCLSLLGCESPKKNFPSLQKKGEETLAVTRMISCEEIFIAEGTSQRYMACQGYSLLATLGGEERDALLYAPTFPECHPVFTDKSASMELYIVCQWKAKERRKRSNSV